MNGLSTSNSCLVLAAAATLAGCGGGSGTGVGSTPTPTPTPQARFIEPIKLETSRSLVVLTQTGAEGEISLRYNAQTGMWLMSYPGVEEGRLIMLNEYDTFWHGAVADGNGSAQENSSIDIHRPDPDNPDSAVTSGHAYHQEGEAYYNSYFVAALPTAKDDVPITGIATYDISGRGYVTFFEGELRFDFAGGTLEGDFDATYADAWYAYELGHYTFAQTVFGVGDTSFSGLIQKDGEAGTTGSFTGLFAGPGAGELIGRYVLVVPDIYYEGGTYPDQGLIMGVRR